jgi:predicted metal-dependent hydrolase
MDAKPPVKIKRSREMAKKDEMEKPDRFDYRISSVCFDSDALPGHAWMKSCLVASFYRLHNLLKEGEKRFVKSVNEILSDEIKVNKKLIKADLGCC